MIINNKDLKLKKEYELEEYLLIPKDIPDSDNIKLRIIHKSAGKHFAEHTKVQILNLDFESIGTENINTSNLDLIIESIKNKGITEGLFVIKITKAIILIKKIFLKKKYLLI